jgi:hypothetical protein
MAKKFFSQDCKQRIFSQEFKRKNFLSRLQRKENLLSRLEFSLKIAKNFVEIAKQTTISVV